MCCNLFETNICYVFGDIQVVNLLCQQPLTWLTTFISRFTVCRIKQISLAIVRLNIFLHTQNLHIPFSAGGTSFPSTSLPSGDKLLTWDGSWKATSSTTGDFAGLPEVSSKSGRSSTSTNWKLYANFTFVCFHHLSFQTSHSLYIPPTIVLPILPPWGLQGKYCS